MPVPTHGYSCRTWIYPTACWHCGASIHVLQCTCGSAVLLDVNQPPWDQHDCSTTGTLGRSGLKGWSAIDVLRASGVPINPEVMGKVFPTTPSKSNNKPIDEPTKAVPAKGGQTAEVLAVVRDLLVHTKRTEQFEGFSEMGMKLLRLPPGKIWQVTLIVNHVQPHLSYTCLLPASLGVAKSVKDKMVFAQLEAKVAGDHAVWIVKDAHTI